MEILTVNNDNAPSRKTEAEYLHYEILKNAVDAAEAMCSLALNLKKMRDERLYLELGYSGFEDYTVNAVGLKKSQAYDYIRALECLGEDTFRSSGRFGISKVKVLCAFTPAEAENFIESNNIDELTVKELKAKVDELTSKGEQMSIDFTAETEKAENFSRQVEALNAEKKELLRQIEELEQKQNKQPPAEPSKALIQEYAQKKIDSAAKKLKAETDRKISEMEKKHQAEIEETKKDAEKTAKERYERDNAQLIEEIKKSKEHSAVLEKQLKLSASPQVTKFSFVFDLLKKDLQSLINLFEEIEDAETVNKLKTNLKKYIAIIGEKL